MKKGCVAVLGANLAWMTVLGLVTVPPLAFLAVHETIVQQHETTVRETTVHHHHTTSNHCPAMPPTAPDPVVPAAPPANNPTAPGNAAGSGSVSAPSAPGVVIAGGVPGAPESPGLVVGPWNPAGGGSDETLTVSGTLSSPINGELSEVDPPASSVYPGGRQWTSNGTFTPPGSGWWANLYQQYLVTPEAAFLETIAPKENYTAAESQEDATKIVVKSADLATTTTYWLYDDANQELFDGLTRWVDAADGGMADQGAATIAAGKLIVAVENFAPLPWNGGTATTWDAAEGAEFGWAMAPFFNGSSAGLGFWYGLGPSPMEADWQPFLTATGVPLIEASGELLPPDAVCPAWQSSAPTAPGNAAGSGAVSAPTAPSAIQAGGPPGAPTAPGNATGSGTISAPSAPDAIQAGGPPGNPTAPGNAAGSGSVSAPSAPDGIQAGGQPSAPTAPGNAAGSGSVSAPSNPDAIQAGGQPSAPTAPGNAAGSGSVSAPSAPAAIQAGGQPSAPGNPAAVVATGQPSAPSAPDPVQG